MSEPVVSAAEELLVTFNWTSPDAPISSASNSSSTTSGGGGSVSLFTITMALVSTALLAVIVVICWYWARKAALGQQASLGSGQLHAQQAANEDERQGKQGEQLQKESPQAVLVLQPDRAFDLAYELDENAKPVLAKLSSSDGRPEVHSIELPAARDQCANCYSSGSEGSCSSSAEGSNNSIHSSSSSSGSSACSRLSNAGMVVIEMPPSR